MSVHDPKFAAAEFAHLAGIDTTRLRDWRRRELLNLVGSNANGQWRYSVRDICVMKVAELYRGNGMDLGKSIWFAFSSVAFLLDRFSESPGIRYLFLSGFDTPKKRRLFTAEDLSDLAHQIELYGASPVGDLADLKAISAQLPDYLKEIVEASAQ